MKLNASLKSRVQRLEQLEVPIVVQMRVGRMRAARERRLALSPEKQEAEARARLAEAIAELSAPDRPGDPVQAMRRRFATRHLAEQKRVRAVEEEAADRFEDALTDPEPECDTLAHRLWAARRRTDPTAAES